MFRILADLNDIRDGVVSGLAADVEGSRALRAGDSVLVHDDGEHEVWGRVTRVHDGLVTIELDMATWDTATHFEESFVVVDGDRNGYNDAPEAVAPSDSNRVAVAI